MTSLLVCSRSGRKSAAAPPVLVPGPKAMVSVVDTLWAMARPKA